VPEPSPTPDRSRYAALLAEAEQVKGTSLGRDAWRRLRKNRVAMVSLFFLVLVGLAALLTPLWPLAGPRTVQVDLRYAAPSASSFWGEPLHIVDAQGNLDENEVQSAFGDLGWFDRGLFHIRRAIFGDRCLGSWCGRDELGRDMLARLFWGARVSLSVGIVATLVSLLIGVPYGAVAGYVGGRLDNAMMRMVDVLYSIPFIFVVIFAISILSEPELKKPLESWGINRITIFYVLVGAIYWLTMARVVRGQVMSLKQEQFVEAARTIGAGQARIIFRHIVPNLLSIIIVYLTLTVPKVMLFEAFLSFLGLGVEPPDVSWGLLANQGTKVITPVVTYWWMVVFPGFVLAITLYSLNFLGDGLRDALDPRLKNRG